MRRNRRRIQTAEVAHHMQQRKCDQRQYGGQDNARHQRQRQRGVDAVIGHADPALEPDGEQQIDRHALGHRLGDVQIGPGKGRRHAKGKAEDDRRKQVCGRKAQHLIHENSI